MASDEYKMFTVRSLPDAKGEFDIKDIRRDLSSLVNNAIKSALPENAYFKVGEKQIAPNGQISVNVYMHEDQSALAEKSARQQIESLSHRGSISPRYEVTPSKDVSEDVTKALVADEQEMNKEQREGIRFNRGTLLRALAILTAIANIARRILSSVTSMAQQTAKDMITANNLSMSYDAVRTYRQVETIHGMKEGTITGGISDIQKMFGNITALDEKALESLAIVMGGKIEEMVKMGLGSSNPEKVLGAILDTFNEKANAGYNSIGQQVGEVQARRELYSYLLRISPQIADIFATMQEEQHNVNSIWRNSYETFEQMKNAFPTARNNTPADYNVSATAGQEWNKALGVMKQILQSIQISLVPEVLKIARWLSNNRSFMSESQKAQLNRENYVKNEAFIRSADATISAIEAKGNLTDAQRARVRVLKEAKKKAEDANTKGGDKIDYEGFETTYELQLAVEQELLKQKRGRTFMASHAGSSGTISVGEEWKLTPSDSEIERVLKGHPNVEARMRAEYEKESQDRLDDFAKLKDTEAGNRAEVAKGQFEYLKSQNTDEKRKKRAKEEQKKLVMSGNVEDTKAYREALKSGDLSIHTVYSDLLAIQSLFPDVDLLHDEAGNELSLKEARAKAIKLKLAKSTRWGYGLEITAPLPALDEEELRKQAEAYAWEKVPSASAPEAMQSFYQWAFEHNEPFFNEKLLNYQLEDNVTDSYTDGGNALTELTFRQWDKAIQAVANSLAGKSYSGNAKVVFSSGDVTDETGVIQHKFTFSVTADGKTLVRDQPIETIVTGARWGDHSTLLETDINVSNGKVNSMGITPSQLTGGRK